MDCLNFLNLFMSIAIMTKFYELWIVIYFIALAVAIFLVVNFLKVEFIRNHAIFFVICICGMHLMTGLVNF